jgi:GTP cyclohydrolase I
VTGSADGFDAGLVEEGVRLILEGIGEDPGRDGLKETPRRVADMYREVFAGLYEDPDAVVDAVFDVGHDEMIMVRDIDLESLCEHHLLPFAGKAHVAYIPGDDGRITGLSKLARLVDVLSKRPQVQERLTTQIADVLERTLRPRGVFVVIEAEHLCMSMRGVKKPGSITVTSAVRGRFRSDPRTRGEAMSLIRGGQA